MKYKHFTKEASRLQQFVDWEKMIGLGDFWLLDLVSGDEQKSPIRDVVEKST